MRMLVAQASILAGLLCGCSGAPGQTPASQVATAAAPSPGPTATVAATIAATPTTVAAAACVVSQPTQFLTDISPVIVQYEGVTETQCASYVALSADATKFEQEHPPTRLSVAPTDEPKCEATLAGVTVTVWGTAAADYYCSVLKMASPQP